MTTQAGSGASGSGAGLFTRQASGLVRELGIPAATGISLASVAVVNTFINFYAGLTSFPQSDMTLPLILGAIIWLVAMFAYRYLLEAIPRAGGEYVYLSRIVSPAAGAMIGISIAFAFTFTLSANAHFAASYMPFMFVGLGAAFNSAGLASAANWAGTVPGQTFFGLLLLGIVLVLSIFSLKRVAQIILALVILQVIAFIFMALLLISHSQTDFVNAFASFSNHPGAFDAVLAAAKKAGIVTGVSLAAMIGCVPFMVLNYNGVLYSYYVGGELKRPGRTYLWASVISLGVLVVVWVGAWLLMLRTIGLDFMQAQALLAAGQPNIYAGITSLAANAGGLGYGLVLSGDPISKILIAIAVPFTEVAVNLAFVAVTTRVLFALAFDRLLPVSVARVSEKNASPWVAIIIAVAVGVLFFLATSILPISGIVANITLFFVLILLAGSLAATLLPLRRPDLILKPGRTDVDRIGGIPTATLIGAGSTLLALAATIILLVNYSAFGLSTSPVAILLVLIVLASGPIIYSIARRQSSIDLSLSMRELPPE